MKLLQAAVDGILAMIAGQRTCETYALTKSVRRKTLAAARRVGRDHISYPTTCDTYEVRGVTGRDEDCQEKTQEAYKAVYDTQRHGGRRIEPGTRFLLKVAGLATRWQARRAWDRSVKSQNVIERKNHTAVRITGPLRGFSAMGSRLGLGRQWESSKDGRLGLGRQWESMLV